MIVVADKSGQLGNRLFLFAHLIGFAQEHGLTIANPSFEEYASYFEATARDWLCRYPAPTLPLPATEGMRHGLFKIASRCPGSLVRRRLFARSLRLVSITWEEKCDLSDPRFVELACAGHLLLCGWRFRDHGSFARHAAKIREYFRPIPPIQRNVVRLIGRSRQACDILVGVHIRRGDYREYRGGRYYFDDGDYLSVMQTVLQLFPGKAIAFLICSNEPVAEEVFRGYSYALGTNLMVEDLYALAECDYLIGPPSTFSMWASFYGQVPLYQMRASVVFESLDQFSVADSHCDYPEDLAGFSEFVIQPVSK